MKLLLPITVNWDGMELKKGQIGVGLILKTTNIYNYIDGELVFKKKAKPRRNIEYLKSMKKQTLIQLALNSTLK